MGVCTQTALRQTVRAEALRWLDTPYHHCGDVLGAGVDCAMLLVKVFGAVGLADKALDPRPYAPQWHLHRNAELYINWLTKAGARELPPHELPRVGDVSVWRFGRTYSHGGIHVGDSTVVHALQDCGRVTQHSIHEQPLGGRACRHFSLWAEGF
ncbi:MAG: NlpC/P60 family protein [Burkholderiaceae bacterium]